MKFRFRHNKSYIDQASSVRVGRSMASVQREKKKKTGENPAILTSLLVNNVLTGLPGKPSYGFSVVGVKKWSSGGGKTRGSGT